MKIGVIGAGNWGTALADLLAQKGYEVVIWAYEKSVVDGINKNHKNPLYLKDLSLNKGISATADLKEAGSNKDAIVFVAPSHVARGVASKLAPHLGSKTLLISCTKGVETETGQLISDLLHEAMPNFPEDNFCFLSGPSFATEVAKKLPTTVVIAGKNIDTAKKCQEIFRTDNFMAFSSSDVVGIQIGGAIKNVIAIGCGIADGLGFGYNTRAAIITRGLYEIIKVGKALGANPLTFSGLAGIGDLILTCTSELSRNRQLGFNIGTGKSLKEVQDGTIQVAEGVVTAKAIYQLIKKLNISAPICEEVYKMLHEGKDPKEAVRDLTTRELHEELRSII